MDSPQVKQAREEFVRFPSKGPLRDSQGKEPQRAWLLEGWWRHVNFSMATLSWNPIRDQHAAGVLP